MYFLPYSDSAHSLCGPVCSIFMETTFRQLCYKIVCAIDVVYFNITFDIQVHLSLNFICLSCGFSRNCPRDVMIISRGVAEYETPQLPYCLRRA